MIKHVVMWEFKDFAENNGKKKNVELAKQKLLSLKDLVDQIQFIEVGKNINQSEAAYDLVLITEFKDLVDLDEYQNHPEHKHIAAFIGQVAAKRVLVDYEK